MPHPIEIFSLPVDEGPDDVEHAGADGGRVRAEVEEDLVVEVLPLSLVVGAARQLRQAVGHL